MSAKFNKHLESVFQKIKEHYKNQLPNINIDEEGAFEDPYLERLTMDVYEWIANNVASNGTDFEYWRTEYEEKLAEFVENTW